MSGEVNLNVYMIAMQYASAQLEAGKKEVDLMQDIIEIMLKMENAKMLRVKDPAQTKLLQDFKGSLIKLGNFRIKEREAHERARGRLKVCRLLKEED